MALSSTRFLSFFNQYKVPMIVFQKRKPVMDRELNDSQWLKMTNGWKQNKDMVGEEVVREGFTMIINGSNASLIDVSPFEAVFADGVATFNDKTLNIDVSGLAAGTYDVVASVTYAVRQSGVDADLIEPAYGSETTAMMGQILTVSVLASTPVNKVTDTSLIVSGSSGTGATLRYQVKSTSSYASNRFSLGAVELPSGQRWGIEDQQDNTPLPGQTTFIVDPGPDQTGLAFSVGVGGSLVPPYPFYGYIRTSAVRYLKLGTVVVSGTPPAAVASVVTITVGTYKSNKDMRTAFTAEHNTGGTHGPAVTIGNTLSTDALSITKSGDNHAIRIDATTAHSAIEINQAGNMGGVTIIKTSTGAGVGLTITNSGSGKDIDGTSSTWNVDKAGNALFNTVLMTDKMVAVFDNEWTASSAAYSTGALGFTPRFLISIFVGRNSAETAEMHSMSSGFAIATGARAVAQLDHVNNNNVCSAWGNNGCAGIGQWGGASVLYTLQRALQVTAFSSAGITITPSGNITGKLSILVVG